MKIQNDHEITGLSIGAAIAVHRELGPGVDESAYEQALSFKLRSLGIAHECQVVLPIRYRNACLSCGYRIDVLVENRIPLELKAVERILPIHSAQLLTYMRLGGFSLGLLLNFEVAVLKQGLKRFALTQLRPPSVSPSAVPKTGFDPLSAEVLSAAVYVHRVLGPGLLRSAYEECLCHELRLRKIDLTRTANIPLHFEGRELTRTAEIPLLIAGRVPVYCLSVASVSQLHTSRLMARLRQAGARYRFVLNFNASTMADGIHMVSRS